MTEKFDFEQALEALKAGKPITGKDSVLGPLVKQLTEAALEAEIDTHLAQEVAPNRKNGKSRKTMKSSSGSFELDTPRDRSGRHCHVNESELSKIQEEEICPVNRHKSTAPM